MICGVDIASSSLEARVGRQGALTSFPNSSEGIAALAAFCHAHQVELVAMEATGGYEQQAFAGLCQQALPVAILAPLARDSGKHQGRRTVRGGRAPVREILFIVASVVGRYEPDFIAFRERLANAGKPPKVVRIALAHKLLVRLNAKAREVRQHMAAPPRRDGAVLVVNT